MAKCEHKQFEAKTDIQRIEDIGRFVAEIHIRCVECGTPFQFIGLPMGVNYDKPMMEVDGLEARLPIAPLGEVPHPLGKRITGYEVKKRLD